MTPELRPDDFIWSYDLADTVESTIPTSGEPGEPGSHWVARGLMVETCRQLLGRPLSLDYFEKRRIWLASAHVSLASSVLSTGLVGDMVSVDLLVVRDTGQWGLFFCDRMLASGQHVPSPAFLGNVVLEHFTSRGDALTVRRAMAPPKYLW